jgi:hypothetical protein
MCQQKRHEPIEPFAQVGKCGGESGKEWREPMSTSTKNVSSAKVVVAPAMSSKMAMIAMCARLNILIQ